MKLIKNEVVRKEVKANLDQDIRKVTALLETAIRNRTPVKTGTLKSSIAGRRTGWATGEVATKTEYACVFDAQTSVRVENGIKTIGTVKVGDKVLTQDGNYHKVIATNSFLAKLKPELVEIETEYRKGKNHKITLTTDHKVLVYRDYRHKWIEAGQLLKTDKLMTMIKTDNKKGTRRIYQCLNCGIKHQRQGEKYCSIKCRDEHWAKGNNPHIGCKRTDKARQKMSKIVKNRLARNPESHPSRIVSKRGFVTNRERQVEDWLKKLGVKYEKQKPIGRYFVDFFIQSKNTIIECDGAYWHKNQDRDIKRDKDITSIIPDVKIIHIHFYCKRHSPKLEPKPLPNVEYVAVNPSMNSYVDLSKFKPCKILKIRKWKYKSPGKASGGSRRLYDLTVDGMHSFYANGIIISNSHVEYGTSRFSARAMFRRGASDIKKRGLSVFK